MSLFVNEETHEINVAGAKVNIREYGYGEQNQINKKAVTLNYVTQKPEMDLAVLQEEVMKAGLVSIQDEDGNDVAVTLNTIRKMKPSVATEIYKAIQDLNDLGEDEKKD